MKIQKNSSEGFKEHKAKELWHFAEFFCALCFAFFRAAQRLDFPFLKNPALQNPAFALWPQAKVSGAAARKKGLI